MNFPHLPATVVEAELDGVEYLRTAGPVIVAVRGDAQVVYCDAAAWPASPAYREAARLARIAAIEAELAELKAQAAPLPLLAATPEPERRPRVLCPYCGLSCLPRGLTRHIRAVHAGTGESLAPPALDEPEPTPELPAPEPAEPAPVAPRAEAKMPCPHCAKPYLPRGLGVHLARIHGIPAGNTPAPPAVEPAPLPSPAPAAVLALVSPPHGSAFYACPQCRSDAFAESLSHPGMCVRCARALPAEVAA